mmetsp:Transcript_18267/g.27172  ORF Transcript_18267/g.27172 Transcript_18267/m.27172 type:complete len:240 (+) Transcript_18267:2168-2887(+)
MIIAQVRWINCSIKSSFRQPSHFQPFPNNLHLMQPLFSKVTTTDRQTQRAINMDCMRSWCMLAPNSMAATITLLQETRQRLHCISKTTLKMLHGLATTTKPSPRPPGRSFDLGCGRRLTTRHTCSFIGVLMIMLKHPISTSLLCLVFSNKLSMPTNSLSFQSWHPIALSIIYKSLKLRQERATSTQALLIHVVSLQCPASTHKHLLKQPCKMMTNTLNLMCLLSTNSLSLQHVLIAPKQ